MTMYLIVRLFITCDYKLALRPLCFFLCFRFRPRITKKHVFFCPAGALDCCRFQSILGDKKNIPKKTRSFQEIKNIFPAMFFLLVFFRRPHYLFFKLGQKCFLFRRPH